MKNNEEVLDLRDAMTEIARQNLDVKMSRPAIITNMSPARKDEKAGDEDMWLVNLTVYLTKNDADATLLKSKNGVIMIEL